MRERTPATGASSIRFSAGRRARRLHRAGRRHGRLRRGVPGIEGLFGWVVLEAEQDPKKAPSLAYAKKGVAHLKAALKESGLVRLGRGQQCGPGASPAAR